MKCNHPAGRSFRHGECMACDSQVFVGIGQPLPDLLENGRVRSFIEHSPLPPSRARHGAGDQAVALKLFGRKDDHVSGHLHPTKARSMATINARRLPCPGGTGQITSKSTSLRASAIPRACDPKRITRCDGTARPIGPSPDAEFPRSPFRPPPRPSGSQCPGHPYLNRNTLVLSASNGRETGRATCFHLS